MPLYDYHCQDCGGFRSWQSMSESGADVACPDCHELAGRLVSAPSLALMPNNNRIANARNEKSADQPELVTRVSKGQDEGAGQPHRHGGHCHAGHSHAGHSHSHGRPWMIGH
ncbi:MAG: FmdB family zinc ribbon protein [Geminicoccaceae bacterium]